MPIPEYKVGPSRKAGVLLIEFGPYLRWTCTVEEGAEFAKNFVRAVRVTHEAAKLAYGVPSSFGEGTQVVLPGREDPDDPFGVVAPADE